MAGPDTRWGSDRTRQTILTVLLVAILCVTLALAFLFVRLRDRRRPVFGTAPPATRCEFATCGRKIAAAPADIHEGRAFVLECQGVG